MHAQTYGFMAFNPGDEIEFVDRESFGSYGLNRIKEVVMLTPVELLLTLEYSVPDRLKLQDVVENVTWDPEVEVRGCRVHRIPTRGFLLSSRQKMLIEDNDFFATYMSAILVAADANHWYESGPVRDRTIRNNRFVRCAEPVIQIHPRNILPNNAYHQNIRIENNEFVLRKALIVDAKSTKNLIIKENTILSEKVLNDDGSVRITDCSDVEVGQNRYFILSNLPSLIP